MKIRRATAADLPTLLEFEQGVIAAERPFDPTLAPDPVHYYNFDKLLTSPECHLVVAVDGELIIGSGYARIDPSDPWLRFRTHAYLGFMFVRPDYRGRGINRLVLDELEAWAKSRGLTELRLEVYDDNAPAMKAYERAGFTPYMLQMRKPIA